MLVGGNFCLWFSVKPKLKISRGMTAYGGVKNLVHGSKSRRLKWTPSVWHKSKHMYEFCWGYSRINIHKLFLFSVFKTKHCFISLKICYPPFFFTTKSETTMSSWAELFHTVSEAPEDPNILCAVLWLSIMPALRQSTSSSLLSSHTSGSLKKH